MTHRRYIHVYKAYGDQKALIFQLKHTQKKYSLKKNRRQAATKKVVKYKTHTNNFVSLHRAF